MSTFINFLRGIFKTRLETDTPHYAIIQSLWDSFIMAEEDINLFRLELCLSTASGIWLDYWGDFFTVHRKPGEEDGVYAKRIIDYIIKPKTTIPALKSHIVDFLNEKYHTDYTTSDVSIKEPWKDIGKLSHKGTLSNSTRFFSGDYYSHSVLDISVPEEITQDLIDMIMSIKAAGVKIVWSFLNTYDVITGFGDANAVWGQHARHTLTQTQRNIYGGLVLSNTSNSPYLSGRREIWSLLTNEYYWYAKMLDKDTDDSIVITNMDLARMLGYFDVEEIVSEIRDTGAKLSTTSVLSSKRFLSGDATLTEIVKKSIEVTDKMLDAIKFVDDWLKLSQRGKLSNKDAVMFEFDASHELYAKLLNQVEKFKNGNRDYYNNLQPPVIASEHIAYWYAARNNNWLFDTPTMNRQDFYELWGFPKDGTLQDIYDAELKLGGRYLTFGDVYQPPIVIAGSPWDWTPILDSPWLWKSATLTNGELEEIYRRKFSGFPDMVEIQTQITTHPENNFILSNNAVLSPSRYKYQETMKRSPESSLRLSGDGMLNDKMVSGSKIEIIKTRVDNEEFNGYKYISGDKSIVTKHKIVTENVPILGTIIDFEENQDVGNTNEKIIYSTREWFQAPVQVGEYALWLVTPNIKQLWDTVAITNEEIRAYWNSPEGNNTESLPEDFEKTHLEDSKIYQPPIVRADQPFYWVTDHSESDEGWLWDSATLNLEDLDITYLSKFSDHMDMFPDIVTTKTITNKTPDKEFRLSDNGYFPDNRVETEVEVVRHPETGMILSHNSIISNKKTEYRTHTEIIHHPENDFKLSDNGVVSNTEFLVETYTTSNPQDNFVLSSSELDKNYQVSGGTIEEKHNLIKNPKFNNYHKLSGSAPEIIKTVEEITYDELPLKYMSGTKSEVHYTYNLILDNNGEHKLSGTKSTYTEVRTVDEHPVILGTVIDLEEQQKFNYSLRGRYQSPVQINTQHVANWKIQADYKKLWNSPIIPNEDLLNFTDKSVTLDELKSLIFNSSLWYTPPIIIVDDPKLQLIVRADYKNLWNTPIMSNKDIVSYWNGKPINTAYYELFHLKSDVQHTPPIMLSSHKEFSAQVIDDSWLWDSRVLNNSDLSEIYGQKLGLKEFDIKSIIEHEENQIGHKYSTRGYYQPPVQIVRVGTESEEGHFIPYSNNAWLWDSRVLNNSDLSEIYGRKLNKTDLILNDIVNYEENQPGQRYSTRDDFQPPVQI